MILTFKTIFSKIDAPRRPQVLRTDLWQLLSICVLSYMAGFTGYRGIYRFGRVHELTLTQALGLRHGLPSHVTIREVLQRIPQSDLTHAFCAWSMDLEEGSEEWYSGDGKVLGSTVSDVFTKHQSSEGVGSIFAQKSGLVKCLGSYRNEEKQKGEPHLARLLIEQLEGRGVVFCLDALHTQKNGRQNCPDR